jgi:hypothetical protein
MKKYTLFSLIIIIQSCITLELGESGYRSLNNFEKLHIQPFESALSEQSCLNENCRTIFEINSNNILELTKNQDYTWVHIWNPYCSNESCVNIDQFAKLENKYIKNGLHLTFISATYDLNQIISTAINSNFSNTIYVLESSFYGVKLKEIRKKLYEDLNTNSKPEDYFFYDDFVFNHDSLIFMGEVNDSIFETIIL